MPLREGWMRGEVSLPNNWTLGDMRSLLSNSEPESRRTKVRAEAYENDGDDADQA